MKRFLCAAAIGSALLASAGAANASLLYQLDITTTYSGGYQGPSATFLGVDEASPDTGYITFTNSGTTQFVGTVGDIAVAPGPTNYSKSFLVTLNAGASVAFSVNSESSNVGGFGLTGATIFANGVWDGVTSRNLSVDDIDVHSGVFRTNPFGVTLDNFVLEGGDSLGRDTGDAFEETQAAGHFRFAERGPDSGAPEPATWAMMLMGFLGAGASLRSARRARAAS